jgi:AraC-like DNA-binding protein
VRYVEHPPIEPELSAYVQCFWEVASGGEPRRVLPDGAMDILLDVGAGSAIVVGPMTRALVTEADGARSVVGVRFRPGAAIDLLGLAAREVRDAAPPLADVWGAEGRALGERAAGAPSAADARRWLEAALAARARRAAPPEARVEAAIALLARAGGELPVMAVAARVAMSERQLLRLFDERVGLGPKGFARVVRLQRVVHALTFGRRPQWAQLAYDCGYADQGHLIREFGALAGVTPARFAQGESANANRPSGMYVEPSLPSWLR